MFEVLGYIFTAIIIVYAVINVVIKCINCFRDDNLLELLEISHSCWMDTAFSETYIIPTISIPGKYFEIVFSWLIFRYDVSFHIQDEEEMNAIAEARRYKKYKEEI